MQAIVLTCPCVHGADKEDESFVVVRLDLTGLVPIKMPSDRAKKSPDLAVVAVKNVKEVARISLHGDDSDCNVFACSAREDSEILYTAPVGVGGDSSRVGGEGGPSLAQHWSRLADWIKRESSMGEEVSVFPRCALRAHRILRSLGQGVQQEDQDTEEKR